MKINVFGTIRALTSIKDIIIEIDTQLTSIRKVMTEDTNVDTLLSTANEQAQELGRTLSGVLSAMEIFGKMGFNQLDTEFLSRSAMLLSTVGEMEDEDSANAIIAAIRQYKMEIADATKIVDVWNELSNNSGTTSQELANGVAKAGSSANMAGVDFETLSSQIATITETMKIGGKEAGNFLKSFYNRILRSSTLSELEAVGVATKDTNGQLLDADKIIQNLSEKWSDFGKQQQNALAQQLGGVYHVNKVSTLLENQERTLENLNNAYNSHNSAAEELKIFQESIQFSINQLRASWEKLALTMGSDGGFEALIRNIIKGLKFITDGFEELTDATDGWNVKLPILIASLGGLVFGIYKVVTALRTLRVAATGAKLSLGWIGVGLIGVELLASAFMGTTSAMEINTEAVMKNAQEQQNNTNNLKELIERHDQLKQEVEQGANKQQELNDVLNSIRKIAPHLIELTGEYGDKLELNTEKANAYIKSLEKMTEEQLKQAKSLAEIELASSIANTDNLQKDLNKMEQSVKESFEKIEGFQKKYSVEGIIDAEEEIGKRLDKLSEKWENTTDQKKIQQIAGEMGSLRNELQEYIDLMENPSLGEYSEKFQELNDAQSKTDGIKEKITVIDQMIAGTYEGSDAVNGFTDSLDEETDALSENSEALWEKISATEALYNVTNDQIKKIEQAIRVVELLSQVENLSAKQKEILSGATEYLNDLYPHLSDNILDHVDTIRTEIEMYNVLNDANADVADVAMANEYLKTQSVIENTSKRIEALKREQEALREAIRQQEKAGFLTDNVGRRMLNRIGTITTSLNDLGGVLNSAQRRSTEIRGNFNSKNSASGSSSSNITQDPTQKSAIDALIRQFNLQQDLLSLDSEKLRKQIEIAKAQGDINTQLKLTQELTKNEQKRISELQQVKNLLHEQANAIRNTNKQYDTSKWFDQDNNDTVEFINQFNKASKEQQEHMSDVFSQLQKLKQGYADANKEIVKSQESIQDLNFTLQDLQQKVADNVVSLYKDTYRKQREVSQQAIEDELDALEKAHNAKIKMLDDELSKFEETINKRLQIIERAEDSDNFDKELHNLQIKKLSLQEEIDKLSLDSSIETQAKRIEIEKEYQETILDIESLKDKRVSDLRKRNLRDQLDAKRKENREEKEALRYNVYIHDQAQNQIINLKNKTYEEAKRLINEERKDWERHYENLINDEAFYHNVRENILNGHLGNVENSFDDFISFLTRNSEILGESLTENLINKLIEAREELLRLMNQDTGGSLTSGGNQGDYDPSYNDGSDGVYSDNNPSNSNSAYSEWERQRNGYSETDWDEIERISIDNGVDLGFAEDMFEYNQRTGTQTYHEGGIIGSSKSSKLTSIIDKLFNTKPNEQIVKALKGELMIPQTNIPNGLKNMQNALLSTQTPSLSTGDTNFHLNFNIDKVTGDESGGKQVFNTIVTELKKRGKKI